MQFGTNHIGHFLFTTRLFPSLAAADSARVVTVTSTARHLGRPLDPNVSIHEGTYHPWRMYGRAKRANLHFAIELHRRCAAVGSSVASLVAHPGLSNTDLQATTVEANEGGVWPRFWHGMAKYTGMQPENGALPQLRAATDPAAKLSERFRRMWRQIHAHLAADAPRAQFLSQMETSPYARAEPIDPRGEPSPLVAATLGSDMAELLVPLPPLVLYDLALGPATRIAAAQTDLNDAELDAVAAACWRAVTTS